MDMLVHYWSEEFNEVNVKYLMLIMLGHVKAQDVVEKMLETLEEMAFPIRLISP